MRGRIDPYHCASGVPHSRDHSSPPCDQWYVVPHQARFSSMVGMARSLAWGAARWQGFLAGDCSPALERALVIAGISAGSETCSDASCAPSAATRTSRRASCAGETPHAELRSPSAARAWRRPGSTPTSAPARQQRDEPVRAAPLPRRQLAGGDSTRGSGTGSAVDGRQIRRAAASASSGESAHVASSQRAVHVS